MPFRAQSRTALFHISISPLSLSKQPMPLFLLSAQISSLQPKSQSLQGCTILQTKLQTLSEDQSQKQTLKVKISSGCYLVLLGLFSWNNQRTNTCMCFLYESSQIHNKKDAPTPNNVKSMADRPTSDHHS